MEKLISFFDYVYYKCCQIYDRSGEGSGSGISGLLLLSTFQMLNLISLIGLLFQLFNYWVDINKYWYLIPVIIFWVINGFHYNKYNYEVLVEKYKNENLITKKRKGNIVKAYMILSVVVVIVIIIWRINSK